MFRVALRAAPIRTAALTTMIVVAGLITALGSHPNNAAALPSSATQGSSLPWQTGISSVAPSNRAVALAMAESQVADDGELPLLRTASTRTFKVGSMLQTIASTLPQNYRDANGVWQKIDDSLALTQAGLNVVADSVATSLPLALNGPVTLHHGGLTMTIASLNLVASRAVVSGSTATYSGVAPGVDAIMQTRPGGVDESYRLSSDSAPRSFASVVTLTPGYALHANDDRSLSVLDTGGNVVGTMPAPVLSDSSGDPDTQVSTGAHYVLTGAAPTYVVTTVIDGGWLDDPARVSPLCWIPQPFSVRAAISVATSVALGRLTPACARRIPEPTIRCCTGRRPTPAGCC